MTRTTIPAEPTTHTLERLYRRIAELEADIRLVNNTIEDLQHPQEDL